MITTTKLNIVQEIKLTPKKTLTYYQLYLYRPYLHAANRYLPMEQSTNLEEIENRMESWALDKGDEYRVFEVELPV